MRIHIIVNFVGQHGRVVKSAVIDSERDRQGCGTKLTRVTLSYPWESTLRRFPLLHDFSKQLKIKRFQ